MNILSIDAETDGLWGRSFWIGAVLYSEEGEFLDEINVAIHPSRLKINDEWVRENVVPLVSEVDGVEYADHSREMLEKFAEFYNKYREESTVLWHMGHIVEAQLFRDLYSNDLIGQWDAPYTPIEVSQVLREAGEKPDSVDDYLEDNGIEVEGSPHDPVYDCKAAATVYFHIQGRKKEHYERLSEQIK